MCQPIEQLQLWRHCPSAPLFSQTNLPRERPATATSECPALQAAFRKTVPKNVFPEWRHLDGGMGMTGAF